MFDFFKTPTEQKRDKYYSLYQNLKDCETYHQKKVSEAQSTFDSYKNSVPNFSNSKIPSKDFDQKREALTTDVATYLAEEEKKKAGLKSAKQQAKAQYEMYKALAISEAQEKQRKKEEKAKKDKEALEEARRA